jgi:hypothetical protein
MASSSHSKALNSSSVTSFHCHPDISIPVTYSIVLTIFQEKVSFSSCPARLLGSNSSSKTSSMSQVDTTSPF